MSRKFISKFSGSCYTAAGGGAGARRPSDTESQPFAAGFANWNWGGRRSEVHRHPRRHPLQRLFLGPKPGCAGPGTDGRPRRGQNALAFSSGRSEIWKFRVKMLWLSMVILSIACSSRSYFRLCIFSAVYFESEGSEL
jgi:hypothetical protein